jgi:SMI1 / KNR4 family (SUKH-1)
MNEPADVVQLLESNKDKFICYGNLLSVEELVEFEEYISVRFPDDYRQFLLYCNEAEFMNEARLYLFHTDIIYESNSTSGRNLRQNMPGMIFFAGDGGDDVFYFDPENYLGRGNWAIYSVELGCLNFNYSKYAAQNFTHLIQRALNEEALTDGLWLKDEGYYPRPD